MALPQSGDVNRILDMGTGWGPLATALKMRFPDAEIWGIDVGAPMVRWAHFRAVKLGLSVNYAQRLAEDTKFKDNTFDIVTSHIMHHEVTAEATKKIVAEAFRVLRPGGVFKPMDFVTVGNPDHKPPQSITAKAAMWQDHRYNNEVWTLQYRNSDLPGLMRAAGFVDVHASAKPPGINGEVYGYKPA
jgi:ubiquinone/menaquinone biosynthesis C-methylase UbiE